MMKSILFVLMVAGAAAQAGSNINLSAAGAVGSNTAEAGVTGTGDKVTGTAEVAVTEKTSSASATVSAMSHSSPTPHPVHTPTPHPVHTPAPHPHPHPTPKPMKVKPAPKPSPKVVTKKFEKEPEPVCEDVKNDACADIEKYDHCGFCVLHKYPIVGGGCTYSKQMVKKEGKKEECDVVLVPDCECKGTYILEAKYCPTCEHALKELLKCAGVKAENLVEIPDKCLKEVGVSVEYLVKCGYIMDHNKEEKKPVVIKHAVEEKEHDPKVVIVKKEKEPSPTPHPTYKYVKPMEHPAPMPTPTASATSSAVASGPGATASASASASVGN